MHRFTSQARQGLERITPIFRQDPGQNNSSNNNSSTNVAGAAAGPAVHSASFVPTGPQSDGKKVDPSGLTAVAVAAAIPAGSTAGSASIVPASLPDKTMLPTLVSNLPPAPTPVLTAAAESIDSLGPIQGRPRLHTLPMVDGIGLPSLTETTGLSLPAGIANSAAPGGSTASAHPGATFGHHHQHPSSGAGAAVSSSFNVPLNSSLLGPEPDDVVFSTAGALDRWSLPCSDLHDLPTYALPAHNQHVDELRRMCSLLSTESKGMIEAQVTCSESKTVPGLQRGPLNSLVTNVSIHGDASVAMRARGIIFGSSPIMMKKVVIPIDKRFVMESESKISDWVATDLEETARETKTDIFILSSSGDQDQMTDGSIKPPPDRRYRCLIYGVIKGLDQAKLRVLTMVDRLMGRYVTAFTLPQALHPLVCGTSRKIIKRIEYETGSSIFFPSSLGRLLGCVFAGIEDAPDDQFRISSTSADAINRALERLVSVIHNGPFYSKDIHINSSKIDTILLERLDMVRQIMVRNASYITLPGLGRQPGVAQVRAANVLNIERTCRDLMNLASQFYSADWKIVQTNPFHVQPSMSVIQEMITDISITSGAEVTFDWMTFYITGLDDAVKAALEMISQIEWVAFSDSNVRVKLEISSEHKEFVSGKKNGKINKIMNQSRTQIVFDGFNEYNFFIDVRGTSYADVKYGLDLVEQELPASISFHVPDQYHKRIIGMGGQNIQRIMKKYSVFVKFSNAMDRDGSARSDTDSKIDNVVCRTPARNAQSLDLVKQEIMEMVEKCDAEFVSERVVIDRLYHRVLINKLPQIEFLERKWNCHVLFPCSEDASDIVTITGPEYQIPQAVDELLGMVAERHELTFELTFRLLCYLQSARFRETVVRKIRSRYMVNITPETFPPLLESDFAAGSEIRQSVYVAYTRNNAGGLRDAIDYLIANLTFHGLDIGTVKGVLPRPTSDSFKDSLPFFASKLFPPSSSILSSSRQSNPPAASSRFFSMFKRPAAITSFSSLIGRKPPATTTMSQASLVQPSGNMSRNSISSFDSVGTGLRNSWNDSGINLPDDASWMSRRNSNRRSRIVWTPQPSYSQLPTAHFFAAPSGGDGELFSDTSSLARVGMLPSSRGGSSAAGVYSLNEETSFEGSLSSAGDEPLGLIEEGVATMGLSDGLLKNISGSDVVGTATTATSVSEWGAIGPKPAVSSNRPDEPVKTVVHPDPISSTRAEVV